MSKREDQVAKLDEIIGISREVIEQTVDAEITKPKKLVDAVVESPEQDTTITSVEPRPKGIARIDKAEMAKDLASDYTDARLLLKTLIKKGEQALNGILTVATDGEHPRAYEVASSLIKTIADVSNNLLELQKSVRELNGLTGEGGRGEQTPQHLGNADDPNIVMVGSFNELLVMMDKVEDSKKFKNSVIDETNT